MKGAPLVSVIMPVFNGEEHLKEAIDSILNQTLKEFEFIIINDGSTDQTESIILSYDDERIQYLKNETNIQIVASLNKGIAFAKGKYIARMDADDISFNERFEKQIAVLERDEKIQITFSYVGLIDNDGHSLGEWPADIKCSSQEDIERMLPQGNCLAHPTMMARSSLFTRFLYEINSEKSEDYNLWLRMFSDGVKFYKVKEFLLKYRVHQKSVSQRSRSNVQSLQKNILARWYFLQYKIFHKKWLNSFDRTVIRYLIIDIKRLAVARLGVFVTKILMKIGEITCQLMPLNLRGEVVLFFPSYHMGGAEKVHVDIIEAVKELKTTVVICKKSQDELFFRKFNQAHQLIDISSFIENKYMRFILLGYWVTLLNKHWSGKVVFSSNCLFFYDLLRLLEKHIIAIDLIHAFGGGFEIYSLPVVDKLNKRIIITRETFHDYKKLYNKHMISNDFLQRIELIENSVRAPIYKKKKKNSPLNAVYVGRKSEEKRIHLIGKVASNCKKKALPVTFTLVGDVESSVHEEDKKACTFIGKKLNLEGCYRDADFLILTSSREGFPVVIMEAMSFGVIPVVTNVGGIHHHVKNESNGCLIRNESEEQIVEDITRAIEMLLLDKVKRINLSENAYSYAKSTFSHQQFSQKYRHLFLQQL